MNSTVLTNFCRVYQNLSVDNLNQLQEVYSKEVEFVDAVETIHGIDALTEYFGHLYHNMKYCHFALPQNQVKRQNLRKLNIQQRTLRLSNSLKRKQRN